LCTYLPGMPGKPGVSVPFFSPAGQEIADWHWPADGRFRITIKTPRFYTGYPGQKNSRMVRATESKVNIRKTKTILEVKYVEVWNHSWMSVRFFENGRFLWVNVQKDKKVWADLLESPPADDYRPGLRSQPQ
jgi:hypothetical protein